MLYGSRLNLAKGNTVPLVRALASMLILSSISICSEEASPNLLVHKGEDFSFDCCENANKLTKSFTIQLPNGNVYPAGKGHPFINKKVTATISKTCKVDIKEAGLGDNGFWKCEVFVDDENHKSTTVTQRYINVALSEPQKQESIHPSAFNWPPSTGEIVFSVLLLVVFIFCCVLGVLVNGQNNNAPNNNVVNNNVVLHVPGAGNGLDNNGSQSNSHEVTTPITVDIEVNNGMERSPSKDIIQINTNNQDDMDSESKSQEDSTQNTENAYDNSSLAINSREGPQQNFENYQKHPKEKANVDNGIEAGG